MYYTYTYTALHCTLIHNTVHVIYVMWFVCVIARSCMWRWYRNFLGWHPLPGTQSKWNGRQPNQLKALAVKAVEMSISLSHSPCIWQARRSGMRNSSSQASIALGSILRKELSEIRTAGTYKEERVITTPQAAAIQVQERAGTLLNFCANNYLGLSVRNSWF